jgi:hypothetical protein
MTSTDQVKCFNVDDCVNCLVEMTIECLQYIGDAQKEQNDITILATSAMDTLDRNCVKCDTKFYIAYKQCILLVLHSHITPITERPCIKYVCFMIKKLKEQRL